MASYWRQRREGLLEQMERDESALFEKLSAVYADESAKLGKLIASYYAEYGEGNVVEYRKLLASLTEAEARLLMEKMDDFARKYPQHAHLMPVRESIYRLNELEAVQLQIRMQQYEIGAIEEDELQTHFERYAQLAANLAAEELGFGTSFYTLNAPLIKATVGASWASGKSFSDTIWGNREALASYLNGDFAKCIARGMTYAECAKALQQRFENVSGRNVKRLIYTEGTFLFNEAQAQVHEQDFECYALSCVNDGKACEVCRDLQREQKVNPVKFSERSPGVNFPPLHPWCRCSYTVEVVDWDAWIEAYVEKMGGDSITHASDLLEKAMAHEAAVTPLLQSLMSDGVRLAGLDYRLKGSSSLARKIRFDAAVAGVSEDRASGLIHDVLRYTYVLPTDVFADEFARIRAALESEGYTMAKVKNTLQFRRQGYRGVNTQVVSPEGYVFELQFHTEESLDVKERLNHPLYERARLAETDAEEKDRLRKQMIENSDGIPTPPRIEEVVL